MLKLAGLNIAIDLGTSKITAYVCGKGIVYKEANAIVLDTFNNKPIAFGDKAAEMLSKTPETLELIMPMRSGTVSKFGVLSLMLEKIINDICGYSILRPNVIISTPVGIPAPEKRTVVSLACSACAAKVSLIDSPVASALGCGIKIDAPHGSMVVDIGAGTTDIAVLTMGESAVFRSLYTAGDTMNEAIIQYIKRNRGYDIGIPTAEKIKKTVGCAVLPNEEIEMSVSGKEHTTGIPLTFSVTSTEIAEALSDIVDLISKGIAEIFEETSPELCSDIFSAGIILAGGGAKLSGLDTALSNKLNIPVKLMADSENCAAKGAGYAFKYLKQLEDNGLSFRIREQIDAVV